MDHFVLHSKYEPTGDQPQAIEKLVKGFKEGNQFETLLGVTGSGKTFTMANVIQALNKPTLIISHNILRLMMRLTSCVFRRRLLWRSEKMLSLSHRYPVFMELVVRMTI